MRHAPIETSTVCLFCNSNGKYLNLVSSKFIMYFIQTQSEV